MITKLTKEQEAQMAVFKDKWIAIGLSTTPMDFNLVETKLIPDYYRAGGLESPKKVIYCSNPLVAGLAASHSAVRSVVYSAVRSVVYSAVDSAVHSAVRSAVASAVDSAVRSAVNSAVNSAVDSAVDSAVNSAVDSAAIKENRFSSDYVGGNLWAAWQSFFDYMLYLGVPGLDIIKPTLALSEHCGYIIPYKDVCFVTEKPSEIHMKEGALHNEKGMAIKWADGWGLYAIEGEVVKRGVIVKKHIEALL